MEFHAVYSVATNIVDHFKQVEWFGDISVIKSSTSNEQVHRPNNKKEPAQHSRSHSKWT